MSPARDTLTGLTLALAALLTLGAIASSTWAFIPWAALAWAIGSYTIMRDAEHE